MQDDRTARNRQLVEHAADAAELAQRVVSNGAEENYASEKLGRALAHIGRAFALIDLGWRERGYEGGPTDVAAIVREAYESEAESLARVQCPKCEGFGYLVDGKRPTGYEPEGAGANCPSCGGRGEVQREVTPHV